MATLLPLSLSEIEGLKEADKPEDVRPLLLCKMLQKSEMYKDAVVHLVDQCCDYSDWEPSQKHEYRRELASAIIDTMDKQSWQSAATSFVDGDSKDADDGFADEDYGSVWDEDSGSDWETETDSDLDSDSD